MAVTFDAFSTGTALGDGSFTHTPGAIPPGTDLGILVGVVTDVPDDNTVAGVTYGGTALTMLGDRLNIEGPTGPEQNYMALFGRKGNDLPTGAQSVAIDVIAAGPPRWRAICLSFFGVDQATPFGAFASTTGYHASQATFPALSPTLLTGGRAVAFIGTQGDSGGLIDPLNDTVEHHDISTSTIRLVAGSDPTSPIQWQYNPVNRYWTIVGVPINPVGLGTPPPSDRKPGGLITTHGTPPNDFSIFRACLRPIDATGRPLDLIAWPLGQLSPDWLDPTVPPT